MKFFKTIAEDVFFTLFGLLSLQGWCLSCSREGVAGEWTWTQENFGRRFLGIYCHILYMDELMSVCTGRPAIQISPPLKIGWSRKESSRRSKLAGMPAIMDLWLNSLLMAPEEYGCQTPPHQSILLWTGGFDELTCAALFFLLFPDRRSYL